MKNLILVGTGLYAELAAAYFEEYTNYKVTAFSINETYIKQNKFLDRPLVPFEDVENIFPPKDYDMFVCVGYSRVNQLRAKMYHEAKKKGYVLTNFIHPNVKIWNSNVIGENVFIFEDNTIQPFVTIGDNTVLWSGNHIGHHSKLGNHCFVASHAVISGSCVVKDYCFIGVNATLRDSIVIEESNVIGAGSLIMNNTDPKQVYVASKTELYHKSSDQIRM